MPASSPRHGPTTRTDSHPGLSGPPGPGRSPGWPLPAVHHAPARSAAAKGVALGVAAGAVAAAAAGGLWLLGSGRSTGAAPAAAIEPLPADVRLTLEVLDRACSGDLGCDVTYRVRAGLSRDLDPAKAYRVTYEVRGGTDGVAVRSLTVAAGRDGLSGTDDATMPTRAEHLSAVVTQIVEA